MDLIEPVQDLIEPVQSAPQTSQSAPVQSTLIQKFPPEINVELEKFGKRNNNKDKMEEIILKICKVYPLSLRKISILLSKREKYLLYHFVKPLREAGKLEYTHPEMPNRPKQAYKTVQI